MKFRVINEETGEYLSEQEIVTLALKTIEEKFAREADALTSPDQVKRYLTLKLGNKESEVFSAIFLDNRHRVIKYEELFRGTIDGASVYPREVVKKVLEYNAAAVIFAHNHPSGIAEPSQADVNITDALRKVLDVIDVRVLDHIVVGEEPVSFTERGLI